MRAPNNRKGFSGWKLTKRPQQLSPDMSLPQLPDYKVDLMIGNN